MYTVKTTLSKAGQGKAMQGKVRRGRVSRKTETAQTAKLIWHGAMGEKFKI